MYTANLNVLTSAANFPNLLAGEWCFSLPPSSQGTAAPHNHVTHSLTHMMYAHTLSSPGCLRSTLSFIVHFLHSGQLLPIWRHNNEHAAAPPARRQHHQEEGGVGGGGTEKMRNVEWKKERSWLSYRNCRGSLQCSDLRWKIRSQSWCCRNTHSVCSEETSVTTPDVIYSVYLIWAHTF